LAVIVTALSYVRDTSLVSAVLTPCLYPCVFTNTCPHLQAAKTLFEEKFKSGKNRWFFTKLRF
jgi:hypothetical protein